MIRIYVREICNNKEPRGDDDAYLWRIPAVAALDRLELNSPVTFFVGENGAGKSTILEAVAVNYGFNAEGGTKNFHFSSRDTHSSLERHIRLVKDPVRPKDGYFLRAESFYNAASYIETLDEEGMGPRLIDSYGGVSLHRQSHGESFLSLIMNRFGGNGFYVLDEPEAALSPTRQLSLLCRIHDLVEQGSQFLIATHSPILLAYPGADIYLLDERGISAVKYEETEHYQISRRFLENPKRMLNTLFDMD